MGLYDWLNEVDELYEDRTEVKNRERLHPKSSTLDHEKHAWRERRRGLLRQKYGLDIHLDIVNIHALTEDQAIIFASLRTLLISGMRSLEKNLY